MTVVFLALVGASIILLTISAASNAAREWDWTWWAGVGSLVAAALIAAANGWAA